MTGGSFTSTDLIAACSKVLEDGGYTRSVEITWDDPRVRVFEDSCGIVAVVVYDTWSDLNSKWEADQTSFAELISTHVRKTEPKAWEGYLVLLTPGIAGDSAESEITKIRYNISQVRKIVATADETPELTDVERLLRPLLPLVVQQGEESEQSSIDRLPGLLADRGVAIDVTRALIQAFREDQDLLKCLHRLRGQT